MRRSLRVELGKAVLEASIDGVRDVYVERDESPNRVWFAVRVNQGRYNEVRLVIENAKIISVETKCIAYSMLTRLLEVVNECLDNEITQAYVEAAKGKMVYQVIRKEGVNGMHDVIGEYSSVYGAFDSLEGKTNSLIGYEVIELQYSEEEDDHIFTRYCKYGER